MRVRKCVVRGAVDLPTRPSSHGESWIKRVLQQEIPPARNGIDHIVDAVAAAWNGSAHDEVGAQFFHGPSLFGEQQQIIADSLYRYPERDRQFMARQLLELRDAGYWPVGRWVA